MNTISTKNGTITINGDLYRRLFSEAQIMSRVGALAAEIKKDYISEERTPILLLVLTGGLYFG
ncbi:MAG: hypothetical protein WC453_02655 [Patescibacteria group bacterium]